MSLALNLNPLLKIASESESMAGEYDKVNSLFMDGNIDEAGANSILHNMAMEAVDEYPMAYERETSVADLGMMTSLGMIMNSDIYKTSPELEEATNALSASVEQVGDQSQMVDEFMAFNESFKIFKEVEAANRTTIDYIKSNRLLMDLFEHVKNVGNDHSDAIKIRKALFSKNLNEGLIASKAIGITGILEFHGINKKINVCSRISPVFEGEHGVNILIEGRIYLVANETLSVLPRGSAVDQSFLNVCQFFDQHFNISEGTLNISENVKFDPISKVVKVNESASNFEGAAAYVGVNKANAMKSISESNIGFQVVSKTVIIENVRVDILRLNESYYVLEFDTELENREMSEPMTNSEASDYIKEKYGVYEGDIDDDGDVLIAQSDELIEINTDEYEALIEELEADIEELELEAATIESDGEMTDEIGYQIMESIKSAKRDKMVTKLGMIKAKVNKKIYEQAFKSIAKLGSSSTSQAGPIGLVKIDAQRDGIHVFLESYDDCMASRFGISRNTIYSSVEDAVDTMGYVVDSIMESDIDMASVCEYYVECCESLPDNDARIKCCQDLGISEEYLNSSLETHEIEEGIGKDFFKKVGDGLKNLDAKINSILESKSVVPKSGKYANRRLTPHALNRVSNTITCMTMLKESVEIPVSNF